MEHYGLSGGFLVTKSLSANKPTGNYIVWIVILKLQIGEINLNANTHG